MDVVDVYGSDPDLWPDNYRDAMRSLMDRDEEFNDYVTQAAAIDEMLSSWDEHEDGADVGFDDIFGGSDEDQDDDQDNYPGGDSPQDEDDDTDDEGETEASDDEDDDTDDDGPIIEIDMDDLGDGLGDMDEVLQAIIRKELSDSDALDFNVFTRDYDVIAEFQTPSDTSIASIDQEVAKTVGPLMKDIRRLIAARSQVQRIPGMRRGRLHGPNLHRILSGDDRLFSRREEAQSLDTAITMNLDCSGSMGGSRLKLAAETAYALGTVLNKLGISFECIGYTTARDEWHSPETKTPEYMHEVAESNKIRPVHRYQPIMMPMFKGFDERWSPGVQRRFAYIHNTGGMRPAPNIGLGGTPEGCGNEFAARRLLQRKEARKIMITMTDGEPYDHCFNNKTGSESQKHASQMVQKITASGIDLVGIGIQHYGPASYYPHAIIINNVGEMPAQLLGLLKKFLVGK